MDDFDMKNPEESTKNEGEVLIHHEISDEISPNLLNSKMSISRMCKVLEQLKILNTQLEDDELSDSRWIELSSSCLTLKNELDIFSEKSKEFYSKISKDKFNDRERIKKKRMLKRKNAALRKKNLKKEKIILESAVDRWIKEEQNKLEIEKKERNLRKDADVVLSDVRIKLTDYRKFSTILQELQALRKIKVNLMNSRGEKTSSEADVAFHNIIDKLAQQWTILGREYHMEEKGLKLMIKTDNETKLTRNKNNICNNWEVALFGKTIQTKNVELNTQNFISIRQMWDRYIDIYEGREIPVGWVLPNESPTDMWKNYLKVER